MSCAAARRLHGWRRRADSRAPPLPRGARGPWSRASS
jgi:hypothetical protein